MTHADRNPPTLVPAVVEARVVSVACRTLLSSRYDGMKVRLSSSSYGQIYSVGREPFSRVIAVRQPKEYSVGTIAGKVALVSGSGSGTRREVALKLASEGTHVVMHRPLRPRRISAGEWHRRDSRASGSGPSASASPVFRFSSSRLRQRIHDCVLRPFLFLIIRGADRGYPVMLKTIHRGEQCGAA